MRRVYGSAAVATALAVGVSASARQSDRTFELASTLERAGQRVERYFARAQTLVCLETVVVQPLNAGMGSAGLGRTIESELRFDWDPFAEGDDSLKARSLRKVLRVHGRPPRPKDPNNCTTAEQVDTESQPLSMLLPAERREYTFSMAGPGRVDKRPAIMVDYKLVAKTSVEVHEVPGKDDCLSWDFSGGRRGRIWLDAETYDVLRLDQGLMGLIDIPLPEKWVRRNGGTTRWTVERFDSSVRFKPIAFQDPDETLLLPATTSLLEVFRGGGGSSRRTTTQYTQYRRFLTGARIVKEPGSSD